MSKFHDDLVKTIGQGLTAGMLEVTIFDDYVVVNPADRGEVVAAPPKPPKKRVRNRSKAAKVAPTVLSTPKPTIISPVSPALDMPRFVKGTKLTPTQRGMYVRAIQAMVAKKGYSIKKACGLYGISDASFYTWQQ